MIAIDTNLLVYAHRAHAPQHKAARKAIEHAIDDPRGCGISLPSIVEFWSVVTHPSAAGEPSTAVQSRRFIDSLVDQGQVRIWLPGLRFAERFLAAAGSLSVSGARVFDLQIGLIAIENGAEEIWTHDRKFLPLSGLRVFDPLA